MERIQTVLVVEDDPDVADLIATVLQAHPYEVLVAGSAAAAKLTLQRGLPDLLVLDLNLPDSDGFELLAEFKQASDIPVIVCSGIPDQHDGTLRSLRFGADDFIGKPFDAAELEARVEAVLRRSAAGTARPDSGLSADPLQGAALRVETARRRITCGDRDLTLTPAEYAIALALIGRAGQTVSHDELAQAVWGSTTSRRDKALSSHIRSLRAKFGTAANLAAVPGYGYRLSA